ncbi:hypothetical protein ACYSNU_07070 [Enterococcus sp. LJL120]
MMNYLTSDIYRLLRTRNFYVVSGICLGLIAAAGLTVSFFANSDPNFPYGTNAFLYSNVLGLSGLVIIVSYLFALMLTSHNHEIIGQSISFGTQRKIIFWSKWFLALAAFAVLCILASVLLIGLGSSLLEVQPQANSQFLIALLNTAPLILAAFSFSYVLSLLAVSDVANFILTLVAFGGVGSLLERLLSFNSSLQEIADYFPDRLIADILDDYLNGSGQFNPTCWLVGITLTVITLAVGAYKFKRVDI